MGTGWAIRSISGYTVGYRTSEGGLSAQTEKMRDGWHQFIALASAQDGAFVARHLQQARASMELYFAQRALSGSGLTPAARQRLVRAIAACPWIVLQAPRKIAGLLLAIAKAGPSMMQFKSIETPNHV